MTGLVDNKISFSSIKENLCEFFGYSAKTPLIDAMQNYKKNPMIGFHIPGHNRGAGIHPKMVDLIGPEVLKLDCTDEFDNLGTLHPATGAIAIAQELAAQTYGAKKTFFITVYEFTLPYKSFY
jgi:arginine/lysine/ornithine decarboxylase